MLCLESDPFSRVDKVQYVNHAYTLQHHTPQEVVSHNRILVSNIQKIYEIHAKECFVEAILPYFSIQMTVHGMWNKIHKELKILDPTRELSAPLINYQKVF